MSTGSGNTEFNHTELDLIWLRRTEQNRLWIFYSFIVSIELKWPGILTIYHQIENSLTALAVISRYSWRLPPIKKLSAECPVETVDLGSKLMNDLSVSMVGLIIQEVVKFFLYTYQWFMVYRKLAILGCSKFCETLDFLLQEKDPIYCKDQII